MIWLDLTNYQITLTKNNIKMARYKVTKDQLERIVENFVMEASIESKKAPVKDMIPSQSADAKKHVKNKMSGNMVDHSEGMPSVTPMKKKLSQSSDAKKHMSKTTTKHTNKAKVVKEEEEMGAKVQSGKCGPKCAKRLQDTVLKNIDVNALKQKLQSAGITSKEKAEKKVESAVSKVNTDNMEDYMEDYMGENMLDEENFISKHKGKIGVALLVAGLAALGITGELQSDIVKNLSEDGVLMNVLKDPAWVSGILSSLVGLGLTGSAYAGEQKKSALASRTQLLNQAKKSGKYSAYSEEVKDKDGNVVGLKDPKTGKTFPAELSL